MKLKLVSENNKPTEVTYRNHVITLIHRVKTNDWQYVVEHTHTMRLTNIAPRYETALDAAKSDIDILLGRR